MLHEVTVTQTYVGWLGFYLTLAGSVSTMVTGWVSDRLPRWKIEFSYKCNGFSSDCSFFIHFIL